MNWNWFTKRYFENAEKRAEEWERTHGKKVLVALVVICVFYYLPQWLVDSPKRAEQVKQQAERYPHKAVEERR